jgi:hypothetical protein
MKNVSILAIVLKMLSAVQGITEVHVPAEKVTQEIHMDINVPSSQSILDAKGILSVPHVRHV